MLVPDNYFLFIIKSILGCKEFKQSIFSQSSERGFSKVAARETPSSGRLTLCVYARAGRRSDLIQLSHIRT